jgi:ceramide glucosyltransferase
LNLWREAILFLAAFPFIYYLLAIFSTTRFFTLARRNSRPNYDFLPPVSNLKPVRGLDPEAYENFASFCRQDYPEYEVLFCVGGHDDPAVPVIEKLIADFPDRRIRIFYGSGREAINDKVGKLVRLVNEAKYDVLVINDADVRVAPDYLRSVVAPLGDRKIGGATCLYVSIEEHTFLQRLQSIGMISDFFPGIFVAWQLDGIKFAFGQTIVTTRKHLESFGGYPAIENRPADDLLVGRLIAEQGAEVKLLPYVVETVADFQSFKELLFKRVRWMTVMRHMRPWGHLGLLFTHGLAWSLAAIAAAPPAAATTIAAAYLSAYLLLRFAMTCLVGIWGLRTRAVIRRLAFVPLWDALAFLIWLASFARRTIRWRGVDYYIRGGMLVPATRDSGVAATPSSENVR